MEVNIKDLKSTLFPFYDSIEKSEDRAVANMRWRQNEDKLYVAKEPFMLVPHTTKKVHETILRLNQLSTEYHIIVTWQKGSYDLSISVMPRKNFPSAESFSRILVREKYGESMEIRDKEQEFIAVIRTYTYPQKNMDVIIGNFKN